MMRRGQLKLHTPEFMARRELQRAEYHLERAEAAVTPQEITWRLELVNNALLRSERYRQQAVFQ